MGNIPEMQLCTMKIKRFKVRNTLFSLEEVSIKNYLKSLSKLKTFYLKIFFLLREEFYAAIKIIILLL